MKFFIKPSFRSHEGQEQMEKDVYSDREIGQDGTQITRE